MSFFASVVLSSMASHANLQKQREALTRCYVTSHWHEEWVNKRNSKTIESPPPSWFYQQPGSLSLNQTLSKEFVIYMKQPITEHHV